ncbi:MAG: hypothetical protein JKY61_00465 [Planctomycetes bacterium]|nr:hypothetical protein [Planctomycetota bacterium]
MIKLKGQGVQISSLKALPDGEDCEANDFLAMIDWSDNVGELCHPGEGGTVLY